MKMDDLHRLTNLTVDFRPSGSTMLWGPIPWQHSWQIVWVKKESKSTSSCCSFDMHASAIGRRICLNLVQSCNTKYLIWKKGKKVIAANSDNNHTNKLQKKTLIFEDLLRLRDIFQHYHWSTTISHNAFIVW